jgi:RHS repeat-associated protein
MEELPPINPFSAVWFGSVRSGSTSTEIKFTGQRLDSTGLYYYGARYYDPEIGRFISPDTIVPNPMNPQTLNRYSYCLNNPLKYIDPSGHETLEEYLNTLKNNGVDIDPEKEAREFEASNSIGGSIRNILDANLERYKGWIDFYVHTIEGLGCLFDSNERRLIIEYIRNDPEGAWQSINKAYEAQLTTNRGRSESDMGIITFLLGYGSTALLQGILKSASTASTLPKWIKTADNIVSYAKLLEKQKTTISNTQARDLIKAARALGVKVDDAPGHWFGHPDTPWEDINHFHIGKKGYHVPVQPDFRP